MPSLVGSEMCIRDRYKRAPGHTSLSYPRASNVARSCITAVRSCPRSKTDEGTISQSKVNRRQEPGRDRESGPFPPIPQEHRTRTCPNKNKHEKKTGRQQHQQELFSEPNLACTRYTSHLSFHPFPLTPSLPPSLAYLGLDVLSLVDRDQPLYRGAKELLHLSCAAGKQRGYSST